MFIFIKEKKNENKNLLLFYPIFILILVLNPIFCHIVLKFITTNVYYRFLWLLPLGIIIAYFGTLMLSDVDNKFKKIVATIMFIGIIVYSGNFVYTSSTFKKINNLYKLPDEYIQITQILSSIPIQEKNAMVSTELVKYIRQYDASIKLAFQRRPYEDYNMYPIVGFYNEGKVKELVELCERQEVNIIVYDNSITLTISPSHYGYNLYAQTEHYDIYVQTDSLQSEIETDEETISIPGLKKDYTLAILNDLHLIEPDEDVAEASQATVRERYENLFKTSIGEKSTKLWTRIPKKINELNPDYVICAADMIDYASAANIKLLKSGFDEIQQEIMYIRADHDYGRHYNSSLTPEYVQSLHQSIDENKKVYSKDLGEIIILGIDNSTSQLPKEALNEIKETFSLGKPIILVTHVPFNSQINDNLEKESKEAWQDRNLTWDYSGTSYTADENTKEFLELLYAENSPVKVVIAGHLHLKNTSMLNERITQYVFDASYKGKIGLVHVKGDL